MYACFPKLINSSFLEISGPMRTAATKIPEMSSAFSSNDEWEIIPVVVTPRVITRVFPITGANRLQLNHRVLT